MFTFTFYVRINKTNYYQFNIPLKITIFKLKWAPFNLIFLKKGGKCKKMWM